MEELRLPQKFMRRLEDFVSRTKDIYREKLVSVILYGSAASNEFSPAHSNLNLAVILTDTSLSKLSLIAPVLNKGKFRLFNVVFFTEEYINSSLDVFPVEFLDMKENHRVLYGKDALADLNIDTRNLRFQCEQELKAKITNIKRTYLYNINSPGLDRLLMKFFTSSLHILRNILRLKRGQVLYGKEDILDGIASGLQIDVSDMKKILAAKNENRRLPKKQAKEFFNSFVNGLEKISAAIDGLKG